MTLNTSLSTHDQILYYSKTRLLHSDRVYFRLLLSLSCEINILIHIVSLGTENEWFASVVVAILHHWRFSLCQLCLNADRRWVCHSTGLCAVSG